MEDYFTLVSQFDHQMAPIIFCHHIPYMYDCIQIVNLLCCTSLVSCSSSYEQRNGDSLTSRLLSKCTQNIASYLSEILINTMMAVLFSASIPCTKYIFYSPRTKLAAEAVRTLLAHSRNAWSKSNLPSGIQPNNMAATEARKPTTIACT